MRFSQVQRRFPRTWAFVTEGLLDPMSTLGAMAHRGRGGPETGSGVWRDYDLPEIRALMARRIVQRRIAHLGFNATALTRALDSQLREQTRDSMPHRLVLKAPEVRLTVDVPAVVVAELNNTTSEEDDEQATCAV